MIMPNGVSKRTELATTSPLVGRLSAGKMDKKPAIPAVMLMWVTLEMTGLPSRPVEKKYEWTSLYTGSGVRNAQS